LSRASALYQPILAKLAGLKGFTFLKGETFFLKTITSKNQIPFNLFQLMIS
jgi:hypothetical protein